MGLSKELLAEATRLAANPPKNVDPRVEAIVFAKMVASSMNLSDVPSTVESVLEAAGELEALAYYKEHRELYD